MIVHPANPSACGIAFIMSQISGTATNCQAGNSSNTNCDADDSRALNNTAFTVANFRQASADRSALRAR